MSSLHLEKGLDRNNSTETEGLLLDESFKDFAAGLEAISLYVPEVAENTSSLQAAGKELIDSFDVKPEFFEDNYRTLIFASLASRVVDIGSNDAAYSDREFISNATFLLTRKFSNRYVSISHQVNQENDPASLTQEGREAIFDRYTDPEHTQAIEQAIEAGLLDEVKAKMGVKIDNEVPYRVRVLSASMDYDSNGLHVKYPDLTEEQEQLPYVEKWQILDENRSYIDAANEYKAGLVTRMGQLQNELGIDISAPAWVDQIHGVPNLCISLPLAEKILYRDQVTKEANVYTDDDASRDFAILEHEYVHTQGGFIDNAGDVDFGVTLEEGRAEYFARNQQGYRDVKTFLIDFAIITGKNVTEIFEQAPNKGRQPLEVAAALANTVGLSRAVELLAAAPANYVAEQSNTIRKEIHAYLGGYDGVLQRLYEDATTQGHAADIAERISQKMAMLLDGNYDFWTPEQLLSYREGMVRTHFLNKEMVAELTRQRAEREVA